MLTAILEIINILLWIFWCVVLAYVILGNLIAFNIVNTYNATVKAVWNALETICTPLLRPIRRVLPDFGALDLSPMVLLLIIYIVMYVIIPRLYGAAYRLEIGMI